MEAFGAKGVTPAHLLPCSETITLETLHQILCDAAKQNLSEKVLNLVTDMEIHDLMNAMSHVYNIWQILKCQVKEHRRAPDHLSYYSEAEEVEELDKTENEFTDHFEDLLSTTQSIIAYCSLHDRDDDVIVERGLVQLFDILTDTQETYQPEISQQCVIMLHVTPSDTEIEMIRSIQRKFYNNKQLSEQLHLNRAKLICASGSLMISPRLAGSMLSYIIFEEFLEQLRLETPTFANKNEAFPNAHLYNSNASNFLIFGKHENIFQPISTILFGRDSEADLIQLATFYQMSHDLTFFDHCQKENVDPLVLREDVLASKRIPQPATLECISSIIGKTLILHIGSYDGTDISYKFGNDKNHSINILEMDHLFFSLVEVLPHPDTLPSAIKEFNKKQVTSIYSSASHKPSEESFGEFSAQMNIFFEKCNPCITYNVPNCQHITLAHVDAKNTITSVLQDHIYGSYTEKDLPVNAIDFKETQQLPDHLRKKFVVINTPGMNHCLYNAVSYALTLSFDMAIPFRRAIAAEVKSDETFYISKMESMGHTKEDINNFLKRVYSYSSWGHSDTIIILSKIVSRKIVVYSVGGESGFQQGHTIYDLSRNLPSNSSKDFQPIFIMLKNNHFSTLIIRTFDDLELQKGPSGKSNQYVRLQRDLGKRLIYNEHNYCHFDTKPNKCYNQVAINHSDSRDEISNDDQLNEQGQDSQMVEVLLENEVLDDYSSLRRNQEITSPKNSGNETNDLELILEDPSTRFFPDQYDEKIVDTLGVRNIAKSCNQLENFKLYLNIILPELYRIRSLSNTTDLLSVFIQRTTFDSFWKDAIIKAKPWYGSSLGKLKIRSKIHDMLRMQETEDGREITVDLLLQLGFSFSDVEMYEEKSRLIFQQKSIIVRGKTPKFESDLHSTTPSIATRTRIKTEGTNKALLEKELKERKREIKIKRRKPEYDTEGISIAKHLEAEVLSLINGDKKSKAFDEHVGNDTPDEINLAQCKEEDIEVSLDLSIYEIPVDQDENESTSSDDLDEVYDQVSGRPMEIQTLHSFWNEHLKRYNRDVSQTYRENKPSDSDECIDFVHHAYHPRREQIPSLEEADNQHTSETYVVSDHLDDQNSSEKAEIEKMCRSPTSQYMGLPHQSTLSGKGQEVLRLAKGINVPDNVLQFKPPKSFNFTIPYGEISKMYDFETSRFRKRIWPGEINKYIIDHHKVGSFSATRGVIYLKSQNKPYARLYGKCGCDVSFEVEILSKPNKGSDLPCNVKTRGDFTLIQDKATGRQCRAEDRTEMAKKLQIDKPGKVYLQNIHNTSLLHLLHQNNAQRSREALQRIRSEDKNSIEADKDVLKDLQIFAKETETKEKLGTKIKGFVHIHKFDNENIQVHLYTQSALEMLITVQKKSNAILYFDATGNCIQPVNSMRLLYYLGIIHTDDGHNFPLAATISYRGRAFEVAELFRKILCDVRTLHPGFNKPLVPIAVCDYSPAVISGLLEGINTMTLRDYIKLCYDVIDDKQSFDANRSIVFVCTSHVIRSFTRLLGKHLSSTVQHREIKRLASHSIARLQQAVDIKSFVRTCKCIYETFGIERVPTEIIERNKEFLRCKEYQEKDPENLQDIDTTEDDDDQEGVREGSPFYKIFSAVEINVWDELLTFDDSIEINKYYCPIVVDLIRKHYVPFAPLWCSMILFKTQRHTHGSISNSFGESEFNFVKNIQHTSGPEKLNVFVRNHYVYFSGKLLKQLSVPIEVGKKLQANQLHEEIVPPVEIGIPKTSEEPLPESNENISADPEPEEPWRKTRKKKSTVYITTKTLPKVLPKLNEKHDVSASNVQLEMVDQIFEQLRNSGVSQKKYDHYVDTENVGRNHAVNSDSLAKTIRTNGTEVVLRSVDLVDLCQPNQWMQTDQIDFIFDWMRNRYGSYFTITSSNFVSKFTNPGTKKSEWQNSRKEDDYKIIDEVYDTDISNSMHILHPLIVNNHWVLLYIQKNKKVCTIYDSFKQTEQLRKEIRAHALPVFLKDRDVRGWKCIYNQKCAKQKDGSSCGLYVIHTGKLLMSGSDINVESYNCLADVKTARMNIVRELLETTEEGKRLLAASGDEDELLEGELISLKNMTQNKLDELEKQQVTAKTEDIHKTNETTKTKLLDPKDGTESESELEFLDTDKMMEEWDEVDVVMDPEYLAKRNDSQFHAKKKIFSEHAERIKQLKLADIEKMTRGLIPLLRGIYDGKISSARHDLYMKSGLNKLELRKMTLKAPFTDSQDSIVSNVISNHLLIDLDAVIGRNDQVFYLSLVLIPETLTRIYGAVNKISNQQAEKELYHHSSYGGKLLDTSIININ